MKTGWGPGRSVPGKRRPAVGCVASPALLACFLTRTRLCEAPGAPSTERLEVLGSPGFKLLTSSAAARKRQAFIRGAGVRRSGTLCTWQLQHERAIRRTFFLLPRLPMRFCTRPPAITYAAEHAMRIPPPCWLCLAAKDVGTAVCVGGASAHRYKRRVIAEKPPQTARLAAQSPLLHRIPIATTLASRRERWRSLSAIARLSLCLRC